MLCVLTIEGIIIFAVYFVWSEKGFMTLQNCNSVVIILFDTLFKLFIIFPAFGVTSITIQCYL